MKLSTRARYGLRAMVELANNYGSGNLSAAALAARQGISEAYLEQLIASLKKAGLINSTRGAFGGYSLAKSPENISAGEVIGVLEGGTSLVGCVNDEKHECGNVCICSARPLWLKLQSGIDEVLFSTTLQDLVDDYKNITERNANE